jgi:hypothetical protein
VIWPAPKNAIIFANPGVAPFLAFVCEECASFVVVSFGINWVINADGMGRTS